MRAASAMLWKHPSTGDHLAANEDYARKAYNLVWRKARWVYAPAGCSMTGIGSYLPNLYQFAWGPSVTAATCTKTAAIPLEGMELADISIGYEMLTPDPLAMTSGVYTGRLQLNIGPAQDFDFETNATASDARVNLNFRLEVNHDVQVTFAGGSAQAHLTPRGGWQQWTDYGQVPARLQQQVPFQLTRSGEFSMNRTQRSDRAAVLRARQSLVACIGDIRQRGEHHARLGRGDMAR